MGVEKRKKLSTPAQRGSGADLTGTSNETLLKIQNRELEKKSCSSHFMLPFRARKKYRKKEGTKKKVEVEKRETKNK